MDSVEIIATGLNIQEQDKQAVLQLATELDRCWNKRDAGAFSDLFETDGDFRWHTGSWVKGKAAIEDFWGQQVFPGIPESVRHEVVAKCIRFVTENVAIGDGIIRVVDTGGGQERVHLETECTVLVVKRNARWYISAARLAVLSPA